MEKFNLENIEKKHPFKVPDVYFEGLTERIHQRILNDSLGDSAENNLESNLLKNFDKKMPFGMPEGYFEDFSAKLGERIKLQNNQQNSKQEIKIYTPKPFYAKFSIYVKSLAIAAAVVLVGGFAYVVYDKNQQNSIENLLAFNDVPKEISNNEIVEYFKEHHTDNNENYVLEHITETHITETHLQELSNTKEISEDILKEIPKESSAENTKEKLQENQDKNNILNDLPKEELQEMLNNGELEEEVLD